MRYYCPKCKSVDVDENCVDFREPMPESMDDAQLSSVVSLVMILHTWEVKCNSCGYTVEYKK